MTTITTIANTAKNPTIPPIDPYKISSGIHKRLMLLTIIND